MLTPELTAQLTLLALLVPLALAALAIAGWRGRLSPQRLIHAPHRPVVIQGHELLATAFLFLTGMMLGALAQEMIFPQRPTDPTGRALMMLCGQVIGYLLPVGYLLGMVIHRQQGWRAFGLWPVAARHFKTAILATLVALPVVMALSSLGAAATILLGNPPPEAGHELLKLINEPDARYAGLLVTISAVVVAPFVEELLYRGLLQTFMLQRLGTHKRWAILLIVAFIFSAVHQGSVHPAMFPALFALGLILGWLYETTGSLVPPILVHALFNAINLILASMMMG